MMIPPWGGHTALPGREWLLVCGPTQTCQGHVQQTKAAGHRDHLASILLDHGGQPHAVP